MLVTHPPNNPLRSCRTTLWHSLLPPLVLIFGRSFAGSRAEPLATFLLCTGAQSSPYLRLLKPGTVQQTMREATREYLRQHVVIEFVRKRVRLPRLLQWYQQDLGVVGGGGGRSSGKQLLLWCQSFLGGSAKTAVQRFCMANDAKVPTPNASTQLCGHAIFPALLSCLAFFVVVTACQ